MYCCTVDLLTRKLPATKSPIYPDIRKDLLKLMSEDQKDRASDTFSFNSVPVDLEKVNELIERDNKRAFKTSTLLKQIKVPSAENIGLDGSRAVWLIAMHNTSLNFQKNILRQMKKLYRTDKAQVFYPGIPYLEDRVMISSAKTIEQAKQLYGTQEYLDQDSGKLKVFPIINPGELSERRKKFELYPDPEKMECKHSNAKN